MRLVLPKQENEKAEPEAAAKPGRFRLPGFHLFQNPAVGRRSEAVQPVSFMKMLRPKRLHNNLEEFYAFLRYTEITIRKQKPKNTNRAFERSCIACFSLLFL